MNELVIDTNQLLRDLDTLASFTEPGTEGWTRRAFSPAFVAGRDWLASLMREAGLTTRIDPAGNLIGRRDGSESLPPILIGSHSDTVLGGGRFDGALGVLAGIAVARALQMNNINLRHPLEIVDFLAEETTPLGACIGSMGMVGALDPDMITRCDNTGQMLADALRLVGGNPDQLANAVRAPGEIAAYLELHIEQGRVLETANASLGVVRGIVGIRRVTMQCVGRPDHAGTTPMALRHDALAAAAQIISAAEQAARETQDVVATIGVVHVTPNQTNVVPGAVELSVEVRSLKWSTVEHVWSRIEAVAQEACAARGVKLRVPFIEDVAPMQTPDWLVDIIASVLPDAPHLPSGAGHDGSWIGRIAPAGMIFVRSKDGRSHCPEEFSSSDDIAKGAYVLAQTLLLLDKR